jgi:hypothetical protein
MITLVADDTPLFILSAVTEPVQLVDKNGTVVGQFNPDQERIKQLYDRPLQIDRAEMERRLAEESADARTTREVFEHLLSLTAEPEMRAYLQKKIARVAERERCDTP